MQDEKLQVYICRTIKMMMYLVRHGFDVIKIEDSMKDPKYKCFLFLDTPKLQKCVIKYKEDLKLGKV